MSNQWLSACVPVSPSDSTILSTSLRLIVPLEQVLRKTVDTLVSGKDAALSVDDTTLPKQGKHSVGVKRQDYGVLGR
jgi:SRSO17 transposase